MVAHPAASRPLYSAKTSLRKSRTFTSIIHARHDTSTNATSNLSSRWLSDLKTRLGKCIHFGMNDAQVNQAGALLVEVARDWKTLLAGSEGYLTSRQRAGITSTLIEWGHQDAMGHVNNVQYVRYCETSRTNWTRQIGEHFDPANKKLWDEMLTSKSYGLILKSIKVDFKFPMTWPDKISVYHKIRVMPKESDSSMLLDVMVLSEGKQRVAAKAEEDVVVYNYKKGQKSSLPDYMLTQFKQQFEEQEELKKKSGQRVKEILDAVAVLEKETWDRPDAKEDMGGTK
ncbi:hypothetical protein LTR05_002172 [Lithohypha guttulata]|uniref:Thioesterase/thiol ester dehydrase-isomerase n=1 Tax=Lithohypha guttulata TaxID=1690604 RepID=A0AAN7T1Y1_9EURO|nr:hypothetical protein LTR05_002172 [Lithohypha guttulata]